MFVVPVTAKTLPGALRRTMKSLRAATERGAYFGARRGVQLLKERTPVDQGQTRAAWDVSRPEIASAVGELARIVNDAPMVGVLERGARPHPVSNEGVRAIWEWVWRHRANFRIVTKSGRATGGLAAQKATLNIAWAIAAKIRKYGQKPKYFIRDSLPEIQRFIIEAIVAATAGSLK